VRIVYLAGSPSIVGDRWLALHKDDDLRLFEIHELEHAVLAVHGVVSYHLLPNHLVTHDTHNMIACWEFDAGEWRETARWQWVPSGSVVESESPEQEMLLSPSGRYLLKERAVWDAGSGARRFQVGGYAEFLTLPDGREVLLGSVDELYGLELRDSESGDVLQRHYLPGEEDFMHFSFVLSSDASRLFSFGCYWACPWGVRMYDFTPWRFKTSPLSGGDLPVLFEDYDGQTHLLAVTSDALTRSSFTVFGTVDLVSRDPVDYNLETTYDGVASGHDKEIFSELWRLKRAGRCTAIIARVLDLGSGALRSFTVSPIGPIKDHQMRQLYGSKLLLLDSRAQILDGSTGVISDMGPFEIKSSTLEYTATSDGQLIVVCDLSLQANS
jgi:hypothetical protein